MRINTNVSALNSFRNLQMTQKSVSGSMEKLSSGFRINKAADDAAGLGIANQMRSTTRALTQASRNAEQANSVLQIAEGSTTSIQNMLERVKELATQAASDSTDADARTRIQTEVDALIDEIDRTVDTTKFQSTNLIGTSGASTAPAAMSFMVGSSGQYNHERQRFDLARQHVVGVAGQRGHQAERAEDGAEWRAGQRGGCAGRAHGGGRRPSRQ